MVVGRHGGGGVVLSGEIEEQRQKDEGARA
jgi:hypothetical protein